jgi:glycine C-acetyltransferase
MFDPTTGSPYRTLDIKMISETGDIPNFNKQRGKQLIKRLDMFVGYIHQLKKLELILYNRVMLTGPSTEVLARDDSHSAHFGVNYASADYLGLAQHPDAKKAAISAIQKYGISAGNTPSGLGAHE